MGIYQPYGPILTSSSNTAYNTILVNAVASYPFTAGYYISTAIGSIYDPGQTNFSEVYSPDTYVNI
ncbi:hypothetical protein GXW82_17175 [Streptacidiphilus sp. 4-A2]|nr:hypothetical protein [Streptacidiphilus sp. 4-A2]